MTMLMMLFRWRALTLGAVLMSCACAREPLPTPVKLRRDVGDAIRNVLVRVPRGCPPASSADHFFPKGTLTSDTDIDDRLRDHCKGGFLTAGEPTLSCGTRADEAYRLTTTLSLHPDTWFVRVFSDGRQRKLIAVRMRFESRGQYFVKLARTERDLSRREWLRVQDAIEHDAFWPAATYVQELRPGTVYVDGGRLYVEGRRKNFYHVIGRGSDSGYLRNVMATFKTLSGLPIDYRYPANFPE